MSGRKYCSLRILARPSWFSWSRTVILCGELTCLFVMATWLLFNPISYAMNPATVKAVESKASDSVVDTPTVSLPEDLNKERVNEILAQLSDDQVRRLLIVELQNRAASIQLDKAAKVDHGFLAEFIETMKNRVGAVRDRIAHLKSGGSAGPVVLPEHLRHLAEGQRLESLGYVFSGILVVFLAGGAGHLIFRRLTVRLRKGIQSMPPDITWTVKLWQLLMRAVLDIGSMLLFAVITLIIFFIFYDEGGLSRLVLIGYLTALVITALFQTASRFVLAPRMSSLRFLPLSDGTALYLYRRLQWISAFGAFGWLTCGMFRLQGSSELSHLTMVSLIGLGIILMLMCIVWAHKDGVRDALTRCLSKNSLRMRLARVWYQLAVAYLALFWLVWVVALMVVGRNAVMPVAAALLSLPLYLVLDWILQRILGLVFQITQPQSLPSAAPDTETPDSDLTTHATGRLDVNRMKIALSRALRFALVLSILVWLLSMWGIDLPLGKAVVKGAFSILVTVMVSYVFWVLINVPIERKLREEMPDEDEEMEEGGAGGSRIGTLLLLLRKFLFTVIAVMVTLIVLSSIGVNIGPLIAGAGVIGLAIGFGAQTLVKDIISGVFFLADDAFRVGDYIETAGTKGMVEHISLRSLRLRHPRGMVNTIPFGDMGIVTNMSRDYIITKLDFRVRYDTDVEMVRKIIKKKVYMEIMKNEEFASKLLAPIKSQGVREMDDSAMIMRVKFKTPPGEQFVIRKEVFRRMQEAFQEAGIEFAHRNVTVYLPSDDENTNKANDTETMVEAGGAAAVAADEAQAMKEQKPQ